MCVCVCVCVCDFQLHNDSQPDCNSLLTIHSISPLDYLGCSSIIYIIYTYNLEPLNPVDIVLTVYVKKGSMC